ncbi:MAG: hypothetical protein Q9185_004807 [Variospora sp. 1 TL-2023]
MSFPFLTSEAKSGATALDIADRQNSHSMTVAMRGTVELFKLAGREKEVDGNLLTFSVSHDHRTVRLYGHYSVIDGSKPTKIYRHVIHTYDITALGGQDRWTTYKFVVVVYNKSLCLLKHIRSVIDDLPEQVIKDLHASETHLSETSFDNVNSMDSQLPIVDQRMTPDTFTHVEKTASRKKPKGKV